MSQLDNLDINSTTLPNHYTDKIKEYCLSILSATAVDHVDTALLTKFAAVFYSYIPIDYLKNEKIKLFSQILQDSFAFYEHKPTTNHIAIKKDITAENGGVNSSVLTIKLVTHNKSFVVDALKALLARNNLEPEFIFYPVISSIRNSDGKLMDIEAGKGINELLVLTRVHGIFDEQLINELHSYIDEVLSKITTITSAWPQILARINDVDDLLNCSSDIIDIAKTTEINQLIQWLAHDNFVFLSVNSYNLVDNPTNHQLISALGLQDIIVDDKFYNSLINLSKTNRYDSEIAIFGTVNQFSPLHKYDNISFLLVKHYNEQHQYHSATIILGHYGSSLYYQSVKAIPFIRQKFYDLVESSGFSLESYNLSRLQTVVESLPRKELFSISHDQLFNIAMEMLSSLNSKNLRIFIYQDDLRYFIKILLFIPQERLLVDSEEHIKQYLTTKLNSRILHSYHEVVAQNFKIFFLTLDGTDSISGQMINLADYDLVSIKDDLESLTVLWRDVFLRELSNKFGEYKALHISKKYKNLFSAEYKHTYPAHVAINDLYYIERASENLTTQFNFDLNSKDQFSKKQQVLKIYSPLKKIALSTIIPYIENIGFTVLNEQVFVCNTTTDTKIVIIHTINLECDIPEKFDHNILKANIENTLDKMLSGAINNEPLFKLIILAGLDWRAISVLDALTKYLQQTGFRYGLNFIQQCLIQHPQFSQLIYKYFNNKFDPAANISPVSVTEESFKSIDDYLNTVTNNNEDKVLRTVAALIKAITRTNCYQLHNGNFKDYMSFKFNSTLVLDLPLPLPYAEIFVYAKDFEAIHLRGGQVARGGIRWSDRGEDYRTEALGLMKAQMAKNTVIVPVGSKGAFYVKVPADNLEPQLYRHLGVSAYCNFLRGLLDLTDNIVDGKIIPPIDVVCYDQPDPYLVVAADKGTASFSDYANAVSIEYNYWLGDAFASGGSAGYDHKKMAITARGAWIAVSRHFQELGINIKQDIITVVGIGDMSGDVFGNGMLLSNKLKLVAAFNHKHIFIDPNPEPTTSFTERARLFTTAGSQWSDYNKDLISQGGGIFERQVKHITISSEIQNLLNIKHATIKPCELISAILKANVDLLWNGGIGTYIKATQENNIEIGDKTNDEVRINGCEVRARVIGEGGNLGLSQRGRIEYSRCGGKINTDFIDNSAGVDCSDHEVNIKIALVQALADNKLDIATRDKLLNDMTEQVAELVLIDNIKQTQAISITERSTAFTIEMFARQIEQLENQGLLDRAVEFLPSIQELQKFNLNNDTLTRPELAVLLSYSKMSIYRELIKARLSGEPFFTKYLLNYFPKIMQEHFADYIINHPLRSEIILTIITNKIVNQLGGALISSIKRETGADLCDIVRAYTIVVEIFDLEKFWLQIEELDGQIDCHVQMELFTEINKLTRRGIFWFIRNSDHPIDIVKSIENFRSKVTSLAEILYKFINEDAAVKFNNKIEYLVQQQVSSTIAHDIVAFDIYVSALDVIMIASDIKVDDHAVANIYFQLGVYLKLDWLRKNCDKLIDSSYWNRLSLQSIKDDLYDKQRRFVKILVQQLQKAQIISTDFKIEDWSAKNHKHMLIYFKFTNELDQYEHLDLSMIILATKKLETLLQSLLIEINDDINCTDLLI